MPVEEYYPGTIRLFTQFNRLETKGLVRNRSLLYSWILKYLLGYEDFTPDFLEKAANYDLKIFQIIDHYFPESVSRLYAFNTALSSRNDPVFQYLIGRVQINPMYHIDIIAQAIQKMELETVKMLLNIWPVSQDKCFYMAINRNRIDLVEYFLTKFSPNQKVLNELLHTAASLQSIEIVELLLKFGAKLTAVIFDVSGKDEIFDMMFDSDCIQIPSVN